MRTIKKIHKSENAPIGQLVTFRALPTRSVSMIDPFLFLNHHGPQLYPPHNNGLPFGPHPHRGMQTVTIIISGDIMHKDSHGHTSIIDAGGVQWMTAGKGLIHAEVSSEAFKKNGGPLEILQLWINLPAKLKLTKPTYKGLQKHEIPTVKLDLGKIELQLIAGQYEGTKAAFRTPSEVFLSMITIKPTGRMHFSVPEEHAIFFYVVKGLVTVNGVAVKMRELAEFNHDSHVIDLISDEEATVLFGHALPFKEPVVAQGPFVMNTPQEIDQAYEDYDAGEFGTWKE